MIPSKPVACSSLEEIIESAINCNKASRTKFEQFKNAMGLTHWTINHCTVRIDLGRGAGHTNYIAQHATDNDLILVQDQIAVKHMKNIVVNKPAIFSTRGLIISTIKNLKPQNIYIDNPFHTIDLYDPTFYRNLIATLADSRIDQTIISLGM
jgi:hypothetical protein